MADEATTALVQALRSADSLGGASELFSQYAAPVLGGIGAFFKGYGKSSARRLGKRKLDQMLGMRSTNGYKRRKIRQTFSKGRDRISGFYGRFKPTFGKELKFLDTLTDEEAFLINKWSLVSTVMLVGRDTGPSDRIGRNFTIRSLQWRFNIVKQIGIPSVTIRVAVVHDKQSNGKVPTQEDIWVIQPSGLTQPQWQQYRNLENISRFEILWDKTYTLDAWTGNQSPTSINDTYYKKVNIKVEMSGTSGPATMLDVKDNSIHVFAIQSLVTANPVHLHGTFRIRFTG